MFKNSPNFEISSLFNIFTFMELITSPQVPLPAGHYSQGVRSGQLVFISGQLPNGLPATASLAEQVQLVLERVVAIAEAAGSHRQGIVKTTVYVTDVNLWPEVNRCYAEFFGEHRPARAIVPVPALHYGYLVEVEAVAEV
jgi:2-iminobutanoate/2-iminopropanoate deaminase